MTREKAIHTLRGLFIPCAPDGNKWGCDRNEAIDMAIEALQTDIVRCKDCKHWQITNIETIDGEPVYDCPFCGEWADANGYCSYGKRRSDE